ncbi:serine O-acetyltransferase [Flavimaricola marinus]|uniref:Serine acetyltransferase n=1 Tax=Flavimaricola marinus TaxID=1819565 RepID=A0A238LEN0_9RHOB|nr:serine acetyltransferase [Flavimaricola marinus]SMY07370.1 Serine acetyltransferase [Flavimaricola marinus]
MSQIEIEYDTSATEPDWDRECPDRLWDPERRLLRSIRKYQALRGKGGIAGLTRRWWVLVHRFWTVVTQAEIHLTTQIGGGLRIPHPNGIVIHPDSVIGPNCTIMAQVTLGSGREHGVPRIGGHVDIGAGAKLLGPITVGDHAQIGANAVVTKDVPAGHVAVGIPARIRPPRSVE